MWELKPYVMRYNNVIMILNRSVLGLVISFDGYGIWKLML